MTFEYDINSTHKDKNSSKMLFACHILTGIIVTFVSTFLVAYMYTSDIFVYIKRVALYYFSTYVVMTLLYPFFSMLVDKTNRVWIYRLGIFLRVGLVILLVFWGESLATMIPLAGFMYGLSSACYYSAYNTIRQEMVSRHKFKKFETVLMTMQKTVNILIPITLGALIEVSTYVQTASYILIIGIIAFILSFFIKSYKPVGSDFNLRKFCSKLKEKNSANKKIKYIYKCSAVLGITSILIQLIYICIMINFQSSFSLGWTTSLVSVLDILEILLIVKFTKEGHKSWIYILSASIPLLASVLYVCTLTPATLIIFYITTSLCNALYGHQFEVFRNQTLKEAGYYDYIVEHQTLVEVCLCSVRAITFGALFLFALLGIKEIFYVLLVIFTFSYSVLTIMLMIYENKCAKEDENINQGQLTNQSTETAGQTEETPNQNENK